MAGETVLFETKNLWITRTERGSVSVGYNEPAYKAVLDVYEALKQSQEEVERLKKLNEAQAKSWESDWADVQRQLRQSKEQNAAKRQALGDIVNCVEGDLRVTARDVLLGNASGNDVHEDAGKLKRIAEEAFKADPEVIEGLERLRDSLAKSAFPKLGGE